MTTKTWFGIIGGVAGHQRYTPVAPLAQGYQCECGRAFSRKGLAAHVASAQELATLGTAFRVLSAVLVLEQAGLLDDDDDAAMVAFDRLMELGFPPSEWDSTGAHRTFHRAAGVKAAAAYRARMRGVA